MKTFYTILRSILTSLFFLILTFAIAVQFTFTTFKMQEKNIPELIDSHEVLYNILEKKSIENNETEQILIEYIDNYINYIFHKRSFPSIETIDYSLLNSDEIVKTKSHLNTIKDELDIEYTTVLTLRNINNILSNQAIYLLINIGLFLIFLVVAIIKKSFKTAFKMLAIASIVGSTIVLLGGMIIASNIDHLIDDKTGNLLTNIFDDSLMSTILNQSFLYIFLGIILFFMTYLIEKILKNKN